MTGVRAGVLAAAIAFGAGGAAAAPVPKAAPGKAAAERLLGRWELVRSNGEAPEHRHVVTFGKDGSLTLEVTFAPNAVTRYPGRYTFAKDAIDYELDRGEDGRKAERLDVKRLTADELTTTDPDGVEERFRKLK